MDHLKTFNKTILSLIAGGVLLTNGCLPHAELRTNDFGTVSPKKYCPGDTVTASYNLVGDTACVSRPGFDCASAAPAITISSSPVAFPPHTSNALIDGTTFTPTEPRVAVTFSVPAGATSFNYPTINPMTGAPGFKGVFINDTTRTVERIEGSIARSLTHGGMCNGTTPTNAPAQIADLPDFSPNLRVQQLCNTSTVAIEATLTGASGEYTRRLGAGECFALDEPGAPAGLGTARTVAVRPLVIDPTAQCSAVEGSTPPQTLTTRAVLACGT